MDRYIIICPKNQDEMEIFNRISLFDENNYDFKKIDPDTININNIYVYQELHNIKNANINSNSSLKNLKEFLKNLSNKFLSIIKNSEKTEIIISLHPGGLGMIDNYKFQTYVNKVLLDKSDSHKLKFVFFSSLDISENDILLPLMDENVVTYKYNTLIKQIKNYNSSYPQEELKRNFEYFSHLLTLRSENIPYVENFLSKKKNILKLNTLFLITILYLETYENALKSGRMDNFNTIKNSTCIDFFLDSKNYESFMNYLKLNIEQISNILLDTQNIKEKELFNQILNFFENKEKQHPSPQTIRKLMLEITSLVEKKKK